MQLFRLRIIAAMASTAALLCSSAGMAQQRGQELRVVVSSKPIHSLVAAVMQGAGTPDLLVDGTNSPHSYAMRPSDAAKTHRAHLLFRVSEELEPFTAKLVASVPASVRVVTLARAAGISLLPMRAGGLFEKASHDDHHKGHQHAGKGHGKTTDPSADPHVWLDTRNAHAMAVAIKAELTALAPQHKAIFEANAAAIGARLEKLAGRVDTMLGPYKGKPFIVFHDATQYFERQFGVAAAGSVALTPDRSPSARRLVVLRKKVRQLHTVCVFSEPGLQSKVVASIVEGSGARSARLDPEGVALSPGPELYFELMSNMAKTMSTCLEQGS